MAFDLLDGELPEPEPELTPRGESNAPTQTHHADGDEDRDDDGGNGGDHSPAGDGPADNSNSEGVDHLFMISGDSHESDADDEHVEHDDGARSAVAADDLSYAAMTPIQNIRSPRFRSPIPSPGSPLPSKGGCSSGDSLPAPAADGDGDGEWLQWLEMVADIDMMPDEAGPGIDDDGYDGATCLAIVPFDPPDHDSDDIDDDTDEGDEDEHPTPETIMAPQWAMIDSTWFDCKRFKSDPPTFESVEKWSRKVCHGTPKQRAWACARLMHYWPRVAVEVMRSIQATRDHKRRKRKSMMDKLNRANRKRRRHG